MSDAEFKKTKITIISTRACTRTQVEKGSNINGVGFNLEYIGERNSDLATEIMEMYERARELENA